MSPKKISNNNLTNAKKAKNDEFYTQLSDIENELKHYKDYFKGKVVFCNCDDPEWSNFWKYFYLNFRYLGLKKLIATHYEKNCPTYKLVCDGDVDNNGILTTLKTPLIENGDFRSSESIAILKEADVVITNPPFSLFREYVAQLIKYKKKFLIIGSDNAITYKEIFTLLKSNTIWLGNTKPKLFKQPDNSLKQFGNIGWFTNLTNKKCDELLILYKEYDPILYKKYDNYDAIEVSKVSDIPINYKGAMGVPITFISKYNPIQFEIIGMAEDNGKGFSGGLWDGRNPHCVIDGKNKFKRIFIKAI